MNIDHSLIIIQRDSTAVPKSKNVKRRLNTSSDKDQNISELNLLRTFYYCYYCCN